MAKILLVEDDKSLREIYGVRLMAEGYEIVSAGDGEEALAMAIKERPDLIVSDVMMPKISGFDMLDILRSTTETKDVKVIMMTALSSDDQRARGEALGADRYLVKSQVGIEDVVRTVHDVLGDSIAAPTAPTFPPANAAPAPAPFTPAPQPVVSFETPVATAPAPVAPAEPMPAPAQPLAQQPTPSYQPLPQPTQQTPVAPAVSPQPTINPVQPVQDTAPQPTAPTAYTPAAEPVAEQPAAPTPAFTPASAATPSTTLSELPTPQGASAPAPTPYTPPAAYQAPAVAPQAAPAPVQLPQPTAPFSSPAPASLGERVIEPLSNPTAEPSGDDIARQIEQALNGQTPPQGQPPVPPAA